MRLDVGLGPGSLAALARGGGGIPPPVGPPAGFAFVVAGGEQVISSGVAVIARSGA